MTPTPDSLLTRLAALTARDGMPPRIAVAVSGGRDSSVLLHALATSAMGRATALVALHVNHGLQADADRFEAHCKARAAALGVPYRSLKVIVERESPAGLEAAAREARYAALAAMMAPGDWLVTAHHADDQAETLLMNLMRGSGAVGLAGIAECRPFGSGRLVRPLLGATTADIRAYAEDQALDWIDDPSNEDTGFDRNFLRRHVLPLLLSRWPRAAAGTARSARLAGEAAGLLDELAALDLERAGEPGRLSLSALAALSTPRQRNLLRYASREAGLPPPPARRLERIVSELVPARRDASPLVRWPGAEARRYRDAVHLLAPLPDSDPGLDAVLRPGAPVDLGDGLGRLSLEARAAGIDRVLAQSGLRVRYRSGGEAIHAAGRDGTRTLKKLLQESGVVPWMRERLPLLYAGDELVAVADLWIAAGHASAAGFAVRWRGRPRLY